MFKKLRQLLMDSLTYGASSLLGQIISFLLLPIYTRPDRLTDTDYGIMQMIFYIPLIFPTLAASGMKSALFKFYNKCEEGTPRRVMLSTGLYAVLASCFVLLIAGLVFSGPLAQLLIGKSDPDLIRLVQLSLYTAVLITVGDIPNVILQAQRRVKTVATLNLLQIVVGVLCSLYFVVYLHWGVLGVVVGNLIGQVVDTASCLIATARSFTLRFDRKLWRTMAAYSLPFLPHRLLGVGMVFYGDFLLRQKGLDKLGVYAVAIKFALPIGLVSGAVQQAWQAIKFRAFAEDPDPPAFFRSTFTYYVAGIAYLWVGLSLWGPDVVRVMTGPKFQDGAAALIWAVCLVRVMQAIYPMLQTGVELGNNTRAVPLTSAAGLLTVLVAAPLLIPAYGALGAALTMSLAWFVLGMAFYFVAQRQIYIHYDLTTVLAFAALAAGFVFLGYQTQSLLIWVRLPLLLLLSLLFPLLLFLILLRSETERHRMQIIWNKLSRFRRSRPTVPATTEPEVAPQLK